MIIFYRFLAAESESEISLSPTHIDFAAHLEKNRKSKNYFLETVVTCHTFDNFKCVLGWGVS